MNLVVPFPTPRSPAVDALMMEGLSPHVFVCKEPTDYGRCFTEYWNRGEPFIICEHDIVPWPGAVKDLAECGCPWGLNAYPLHQGNVAQGFGFAKYTPEGPAPAIWRETEWRMLDGQVIPHMRKLWGKPHRHEPAVAHAREQLT